MVDIKSNTTPAEHIVFILSQHTILILQTEIEFIYLASHIVIFKPKYYSGDFLDSLLSLYFGRVEDETMNECTI